MFQPSTVAPVARRPPWGSAMCCQIVLLVGCQPGSQHMSWMVSWLLSDCSKLSPWSGASFLKLIRREPLPTVVPLFLQMEVRYQYSLKNVVKKNRTGMKPCDERLTHTHPWTCKRVHTASVYSHTAGCQAAAIAQVGTETKLYTTKHVFSNGLSYLWDFTNRFSHMSELHRRSLGIVAVTNVSQFMNMLRGRHFLGDGARLVHELTADWSPALFLIWSWWVADLHLCVRSMFVCMMLCKFGAQGEILDLFPAMINSS